MDEIIKKSVPDEIRYLARILNKAGYSFFIVGGFVRDIFTGSCDAYENDIDTCGNCTPDTFAKLISEHKAIKLCEANYPLGTLKIIIKHLDIEYTCFRKESYRGDGHHTPTKIQFTDDIYTDASRRDFTVNSLYLDPLTYEIKDFFDGVNHISRKVLKTTRDSKDVFTEDALRILRMCRFSAKLGFKIEKNTLNGASHCAPLLKSISYERIGVEMDKIIWDTEHIKFGINAIYKAGINKIICPDVKKRTADRLINSVSTPAVRWALFLSDLSAKDAEKYILNLSLGRQMSARVRDIIKNKNVAGETKQNIILTFAKLGTKASADVINFTKAFSIKECAYLKNVYKEMIAKEQFIDYSSLKIDGNDIMRIMNVKGIDIKRYKEKVYEYAVLNPEKNNFNELSIYLKSI